MRLPKLRIISFLLLFVIKNVCFSQDQPIIDSLLKELKTAKVDTIKARILNDLSWEYNQGNSKKAFAYANELLEFSQNIKYNWGIAAAYTNIAFCYEHQGNYPNALKYHIMNLELCQKIGRKKNIARAYNNIGIIYNKIREYDKALEYYFKKLAIVTSLDNFSKKEIAKTYNNIGVAYKDKNEIDSALKYVYIAKKYAIEIQDSSLLTDVYVNLGETYEAMEKTQDKSLENYGKALVVAKKINFQRNLPLIYVGMACVYRNTKQYDRAILYAEKGIASARIHGPYMFMLYGYELLMKVCEEKKDYKAKSDYMNTYMLLKDSITNKEKNEQISNLRVQFETAEKEKENEFLSSEVKIKELELNRSKYIVFSLIGTSALLILIFVLVLLIVRQNRLKSKQNAIQLEQKLLRSQMNPHFIFNSLASIESFIYEHQPKEAGRYLSDFSRLMRLILENSASEYITLEKEIETLKYYLALQKLRLNDNLTYTIEADEQLNQEEIYLPPMLTQPFIENAIEHGFRGSKQKAILSVHFRIVNAQLQIEITDNGIGIVQASQQKELHKSHKSMAMQITQERLSFLNKSKRNKFLFSVQDLSESEASLRGTKIIFSIPLD